ncbi:MAG: hypothetical protein K2O22_04700, partial [Anaeroplasmataceae bacterium]|nr:hypothetical protein [Anaeroplasmataceae bacterium]
MKKYILCLLFSLFLLTSCVAGGYSSSDILGFSNYVGESFDIKFNTTQYSYNGWGGQFKTDKSLEVIQSEILKKNDCKAAIYEDHLIIEKDFDQTTQLVTISK